MRGWDRERLLQDVLKRDELKFWPKNIDTTPYANLLCLATMVGGLNVKMLKHPPGRHRPTGIRNLQSAAITAPWPAPVSEPEDGDMLPPLLPDIIGRIFRAATSYWHRHTRAAEGPDRELPGCRHGGWRGVDLAALWSHLDRQTLDFPEDVPLALLDAPQIDSAEVQWLSGGHRS